jgi:predicted molibdopterin-dependent oxidoreductase YjgC
MNITLNGKHVSAQPGATILDVARREGFEIPTLCHHPALAPEASCRLCVVRDCKSGKLVPACATYVAEGMNIETDNDHLHETRRLSLELLLARHPLDCMTCEQNGACELQDLAYEFQVDGRTFGFAPRPGNRDLSHPFIALDPDKCILCHRCVRGCAEIQGRKAIGIYERGADSRVAPGAQRPWIESICESCGTCIALCPTGALVEKQSMRKGRTWEFEKVTTLCPYCGVGCTIDLNVKNGRVSKVTSNWTQGVNRGALCVKGRFGYEFIDHPARLTTPLIREGDGLREASWDEALDLVAQKFVEAKNRSGPDALAVVASAKATNEENYLIQKFTRAVLGTNNVDHCARL